MIRKTTPDMWAGIIIVGVVLLALPAAPAAYAQIYMFKDAGGVMHFTNTPTSSNYKPYTKKFVFYPRPRVRHSPKHYDNHIRLAANRFDIPFSLVKSVIKVESNFNPRAVSTKGAKGLMQIMPFNFKDLAIRNPYDPHENIQGGACYLKRMLDRFEGKMSLALAAYNAGPEAVDKYKTIPPYPETQNFVRKVMQFYQMYQRQG